MCLCIRTHLLNYFQFLEKEGDFSFIQFDDLTSEGVVSCTDCTRAMRQNRRLNVNPCFLDNV